MVSEDVLYLPIRQLAERIRARRLSPVELTNAYLARSERIGGRLHAYVTLTPELARAQARRAEQEIAAGHYRGPLHGIPYAAKDLLAVKGYPTTWGARPFAEQRFDYDATAIERLNAAGAVLIGKAAMIELAGGLGYTGPYASLTGPCHNPWDVTRWTCGSSSGSGAIASAALAAFALGSDTRGSIICPSSWCGISGLRPSFGRVSRHGVMAIAWSMDKIGPMARSADCCALVLETIAGHDPHDFDSLPAPQAAFRWNGGASGPRLRIGRLTNVFPNARPEIHAATDAALRIMERQGAQVADAQLPDGPFEEAAELVILIEAASSFSRLIDSGRCAQLEDPLGQINGYVSRLFSAHDLLHIERLRTVLQRDIDRLFDRFDVLAAPGEGETASPIGPPPGTTPPAPPRPRSETRRRRYQYDSKQPDAISSLCGLPALSVPAGLSAERLPINVQFMGRALRDDLVLEAGRFLQAHSDFHRHRPPT